jgi:predicted nucleotidyltransferase
MKIVGLITEYNPFHNGHLYHIRESLRITGADAAYERRLCSAWYSRHYAETSPY